MCMICSGLKTSKLSLMQAKEKYEEFLELDLIDEEHQEEIESLISEAESEDFYWTSAKKDYLRSRQDYEDSEDFDENDEALFEEFKEED